MTNSIPACWGTTPNLTGRQTGDTLPKKSRPTFQKREKEKARQQRQKDKQARRLEAKERRAEADPRVGGEDPDIAGIRPGPQALPEQWELNS